jgi:ketosteroid isomerase-like protein
MRAHAVVAASLLLASLGVPPRAGAQLTKQQETQVKHEVTAVGDSIMANFERMDVNGALSYYARDFVGFGAGGGRIDLEYYRKSNLKLYEGAASYKWTYYGTDFLVVTRDIVVVAWDGKNELFYKSGDKMRADPSHYTFAFRKVAGQWKLAYQHFSGKMVTEKAVPN